ncbi:cobalt-zinc-cadmium efflux system protein [Paenibacillus sp. BK033]|uniref:cation diffusion facilitator family transporter n=1 Tax=Paenibacillus sp. BK033 TaxID=2512133 RepID=UPI001052CDA0|nr:cation diffusion facilitator family transporter [Paenibacillus sp. BK033]TCM99646.1 cobalt-zinc-cadmium efflux system protein [Paenibacillus sp. BK033]
MNKGDYHHLPHVKEQSASKKTLWLTLTLTSIFTAIEIIGGLLSGSLALLSDSAHMVSDVLALGLSMFAIYMASRQPTSQYTFGFVRFEIMASFLNGLALVAIAGFIWYEGVQRQIHPEPVDMGLMLGIAVIGLIVNVVLTLLLHRSAKEEENLNVKSALWHFIGDTLSSAGVIVSAILMKATGILLFDPIISMVIGGIIAIGGVKIIRESYVILMEAVPEQFNLESIRQDLSGVTGVLDVHDMHLWAVSTDHYSLTAHVLADSHTQPYCITLALTELLKEKYGIVHSTIQIEHAAIHHHGEYGRQFLTLT